MVGVTARSGNRLLEITAAQVLQGIKTGDSVAVNGVCLTVVSSGDRSFGVEASHQTREASTLGHWGVGRKVNLERALQLGGRLAGHLVQGHIDGIGRVSKVKYGEGSNLVTIAISPDLLKLVAPKGSIAVDGVSLTVYEKSGNALKLMLIPYTLSHTALGDLKPGDEVNIETDLFIRWLADRFPDGDLVAGSQKDWLQADGFHLED